MTLCPILDLSNFRSHDLVCLVVCWRVNISCKSYQVWSLSGNTILIPTWCGIMKQTVSSTDTEKKKNFKSKMIVLHKVLVRRSTSAIKSRWSSQRACSHSGCISEDIPSCPLKARWPCPGSRGCELYWAVAAHRTCCFGRSAWVGDVGFPQNNLSH